MKINEFEELKENFRQSDVEDKIDIYMSTEDLTQPQYKELLKLFPLEELNRLEMALSQA